MDDDRERALFIPEKLLTDTENLPMTPRDRWTLEGTIAAFMAGRTTCLPYEGYGEQGSARDATTLPKLIDREPVVWIGELEENVSGWSPWLGEVAQIHYFTVEEVIRGLGRQEDPQPSDTLGLISGVGGNVLAGGVRICQDGNTKLRYPLPGERFLVAGSSWEADPHFFLAGPIFPVVDDEVQPQPYPQVVKGEASRELAHLRTSLRRSRGRPQ